MSVFTSKLICNRPIIGVFVGKNNKRKLVNGNKTSIHLAKFIESAKANQEAKTTLYFFSDKDVDFERGTINGTYFNEKKTLWEEKEFPFPDVLYDKGGGGTKKSQYIREQLEKMGIKKINPQHYFNKWDVYQKLVKCKQIDSYLPLTIIYKSPNDLKMMFAKSNVVYLKSISGRFGREVIRVTKLTNGKYECSYFRRGVVYVQSGMKWKSLINVVILFFQRKEFVVQQAIDLPVINNSIVDMRAEIVRNGQGELEIIEILVRMAKEGSPITTKGATYRFHDFYKQFFPSLGGKVKRLRKQIETFLFKMYHAIEQSYGTFGEIAIDFGIDKQGNILFIECNAKSGKTALYRTQDKELIRNAFLLPLEYAKFLYRDRKGATSH